LIFLYDYTTQNKVTGIKNFKIDNRVYDYNLLREVTGPAYLPWFVSHKPLIAGSWGHDPKRKDHGEEPGRV